MSRAGAAAGFDAGELVCVCDLFAPQDGKPNALALMMCCAIFSISVAIEANISIFKVVGIEPMHVLCEDIARGCSCISAIEYATALAEG